MTTTAKEQREGFAPADASATPAPSPLWAISCLNCGSTLAGPFCSKCGQRAAPPHPRLRDLGGEAFSEFAGWDGKFVTTLKLLFLKPGELTRQFLEGRRADFISPLRLYLSASVLFFLLSSRPHPAPPQAATAAAPPKVLTPAQQERKAKADADRQLMLDNLQAAPAIMRPLILKAATDQRGLAFDVSEALPKGLFVLLPIFAGIMLLFYRERHFAEHLYFAIHLHAFIFAALDVAVIFQFLHSSAVSFASVALLSLWVPLYTHLAIVRVYGGPQGKTLAKELGISALYAAASIPVVTVLAMWVAWSTS